MHFAWYVRTLAVGIGLTRDVVIVGLVWDHGIARRSASSKIGREGTNILALGGGLRGLWFAIGGLDIRDVHRIFRFFRTP